MADTKAAGSHAHDLTAAQRAIIDGKASQSALDALAARVTALETIPPPVPNPPSGYDATFTATGSDDALRLRDWVTANRGKRLLIEGIVRTSGSAWTMPPGPTTTIDFAPGAALQMIDNASVLFLRGCWDLVLNHPRVVGAGWDGLYVPARQWDHGIQIEGGGRITLDQPDCRNTRGDGIDIDQRDALGAAPVDVVVNHPILYQNARNGITINAGKVTVNGGTSDRAGLHNIDMEPNWDSAATTIDATIDGVRLTNHGVLTVFDVPGQDIRGFAIAGLGYSRATKRAIRIRGCSSDEFTLAVDRAAAFEFAGNASDRPVTACGPGPAADTVFAFGMGTSLIERNTGICVNTTWDLRA